MRNSFLPGQILRFTHIAHEHTGHNLKCRAGYQLKYIDPVAKIGKRSNLAELCRYMDSFRMLSLPCDSTIMFIGHCPGFHSNWDRTPGPHVEHDCIYNGKGHAIVIVGEEMLQMSYNILRRVET